MITIHKFVLTEYISLQKIKIPGLLKILAVKEQRGEIVLYAIVDTEYKHILPVKVAVIGTGHNMDISNGVGMRYMDTIMMERGELVFHIFYKVEDRIWTRKHEKE